MGVLTDLKARGLEDILVVCTDNLKGFTDGIKCVFPKSASHTRFVTVANTWFGKTEKLSVLILKRYMVLSTNKQQNRRLTKMYHICCYSFVELQVRYVYST